MAAGPVTAHIEATATSIGAGMLLGGFIAGLIALVTGLGAAERDQLVFAIGSAAGALTAAIAAMETIVG